ncbi:MAG: hypothetical protein OER82_01300 [Nitrosopumilus sp.]|nr:hypothetical protein [Nitrosopumilus sp.]
MYKESPRSELEKLANRGFELIRSINDDLTIGDEVYETYNDILFDTIKSEFQSMESALSLIHLNKYKDSFIILRSVFETLLYFWLMIKGKKYRFTREWTITPKEGHTVKEGRDLTYEQWCRDWKTGVENYKNVTSINKKSEDKILLTRELEGLFEDKDIEKKKIYPFYTFVLSDHYSPSITFTADLPSIKEGSFNPDLTEKLVSEQKTIYHNYIRIEAIIKNLILNNIITEIQRDYIVVHYNFLSHYVHQSKYAIQDFTKDISIYRRNQISSDIVDEQILLYICSMQSILLKTIIDKFEKENPKASVQKYKELIFELDSSTEYFWFIDNEPTLYDKWLSDIKTRSAERFRNKPKTDIVLYYEDPLERLQKMKDFNNNQL